MTGKINLRVTSAAVVFLALLGAPAMAYDGTNCSEPGVCWEPKPGYPAKLEGTKYDPKHDPVELNRQTEALDGMSQRNALRLAHFKKSGEFIYDVDDIPTE